MKLRDGVRLVVLGGVLVVAGCGGGERESRGTSASSGGGGIGNGASSGGASSSSGIVGESSSSGGSSGVSGGSTGSSSGVASSSGTISSSSSTSGGSSSGESSTSSASSSAGGPSSSSSGNVGSSSSSSSSGAPSSSSSSSSGGNVSSSSGGSSGTGACAGAQELGAGTFNGSTVGLTGDALQGCGGFFYTVGAGAPEQVWRLPLAQAGGVRINLQGYDAALYLLAGNTCETATLTEACVDGSGNTETLEMQYLEAGTYWLVVDGYNDTNGPTTGAYTLTVELIPGGFCAPDVGETQGFNDDNNVLERALGPVGDVDGEVQLSICNGDEDWFTITHEGGDVTVTARRLDSGSGTLDVDLYTVARDAADTPTGTLLSSYNFTNNTLSAPALAPGEYALRVFGAGVPTAGMHYGFNLDFSCQSEDEMELRPNNVDVKASGPFGPGEEWKSGTLCPQDVDWLWFRNGATAGPVTVTFSNGANLALTTHSATVDANGVITGSSPNANIQVSTSGANKVVTHANASADESFLVRVSPSGSVPAVGLNYTVTMGFPGPGNDTCATAEPLTLPAPGAAALVVSGDTTSANDDLNSTDTTNCGGGNGTKPEVFYAFTTTNAVRMTAETANHDTLIYLLRGNCATNTEVACNDDIDFNGGVYESRLQDVLLDASTSYILVVDSYSSGGPFTLSITTANP
ncbi:MAG: hypothetical protein AB2A00_17505 [Myxococcota bacterium]